MPLKSYFGFIITFYKTESEAIVSIACIWKRIVLFQSTVKQQQLLKTWIRVSPCNLQQERKVKRNFRKRNSILLRYKTMF